MRVSEQVESWIEWSKANLPATGDIPKINSTELRPPWLEDALETVQMMAYHRDELLTCFRTHLDAKPIDIPSRFTALHVYSAFIAVEEVAEYLGGYCTPVARERGGEEAIELIEESEREARQVIEASAKDLADLVHRLDVDKVPADWRFIRWEILNSYAVGDWDRALKLYDRAGEPGPLELTDLQLMRGQFRYLLVYASEFELGLYLLWWEPKVYGPDDPERFLLLFLSGLSMSKPETHLTHSHRDTLRGAANDLEKALDKTQGAAPADAVYRAVLARCHSSLGRFREAAAQYAKVLSSQLVTLVPFLKKPVYKALTSVYRAGGELQEAINTLEQWAQDFPEEKGIYLQVAELKAEMGDFDSVLIAIRNEEERNPEADRDWRVTSLLALGDTRDVSRKLLSALKSDEEVYYSTVALLREYWPAYATLSAKAQEEWTAGSLLWNCLPGKPMRNTWLRKAALCYASAAEIELRARFFTPFRDRVRRAPELLTIAQQGRTDKDAGIFCQFIVSGNGSLTLLQMASILGECNRPQKPILKEFKAWLGPAHPVLAKQVPALREIGAFRNPGTHEATSTTTMERVPEWCRSVIEALIQAGSNLNSGNVR